MELSEQQQDHAAKYVARLRAALGEGEHNHPTFERVIKTAAIVFATNCEEEDDQRRDFWERYHDVPFGQVDQPPGSLVDDAFNTVID